MKRFLTIALVFVGSFILAYAILSAIIGSYAGVWALGLYSRWGR
jgi:hypothetical protein